MAEEERIPRELKKGLIDLSILSILYRDKKYGLQIIKELDSSSGGILKLKEGTLYPALHRLEAKGLVKSEWIISDSGMPRRYYVLTEDGKRAYCSGRRAWERLVKSMENVLGDCDE